MDGHVLPDAEVLSFEDVRQAPFRSCLRRVSQLFCRSLANMSGFADCPAKVRISYRGI